MKEEKNKRVSRAAELYQTKCHVCNLHPESKQDKGTEDETLERRIDDSFHENNERHQTTDPRSKGTHVSLAL